MLRNGINEFFELSNTEFGIVGDRVDFGSVAGRENHPAASMFRQAVQMLSEGMCWYSDALQEFDRSTFDIYTSENEIQFMFDSP